MSSIIEIKPLGFPWETKDPFLFCAHHADAYPAGNENLGPDPELLQGRNIGQDFTIKDGFRMYHGTTIPGFPSHPHRGFETVTIAQEGLVDHSDSMGAAGRFGNGDVQWMTAGKGVQHSEMFPLLNGDQPNHLHLFQIWLNLPKARKFAEPHFAMLWSEDIPKYEHKDENGNKTKVTVVAGKLGNVTALAPAPDSWAINPVNEVCIWTIKMEPNARWIIPAASDGLNRTLYFFKGDKTVIDGQEVPSYSSIDLVSSGENSIKNDKLEGHFLFLQGKPINEPVAQYGPFVMNSEAEIRQTMADYQQTQFGGWPWPSSDHVHPREKGRFAKHADGRLEEK
jgi:hypothetical protein